MLVSVGGLPYREHTSASFGRQPPGVRERETGPNYVRPLRKQKAPGETGSLEQRIRSPIF